MPDSLSLSLGIPTLPNLNGIEMKDSEPEPEGKGGEGLESSHNAVWSAEFLPSPSTSDQTLVNLFPSEERAMSQASCPASGIFRVPSPAQPSGFKFKLFRPGLQVPPRLSPPTPPLRLQAIHASLRFHRPPRPPFLPVPSSNQV
eukprot:898947-Rhodomonas_salina.1